MPGWPMHFAVFARGISLCQWRSNGILEVARSLLRFRAGLRCELGPGLPHLPLLSHGYTKLRDFASAGGALEAPWGKTLSLFSYSFTNCTLYSCRIYWFYMLSRFTNYSSYSCKLYLTFLQIGILQIVPYFLVNRICVLYLTNYHLANYILLSCNLYVHALSCKLYITFLQTIPMLFVANYHLANCHHALFLQTIILQTMSMFFSCSVGPCLMASSFVVWMWTWVRAYLNGLYSDTMSKKKSSCLVIIACLKVSF